MNIYTLLLAGALPLSTLADNRTCFSCLISDVNGNSNNCAGFDPEDDRIVVDADDNMCSVLYINVTYNRNGWPETGFEIIRGIDDLEFCTGHSDKDCFQGDASLLTPSGGLNYTDLQVCCCSENLCNGDDVWAYQPTTTSSPGEERTGGPGAGEIVGYSLLVLVLVTVAAGAGWALLRWRNRSSPYNVFGRLHVSYRRNSTSSSASNVSLGPSGSHQYRGDPSHTNGVMASYQFDEEELHYNAAAGSKSKEVDDVRS